MGVSRNLQCRFLTKYAHLPIGSLNSILMNKKGALDSATIAFLHQKHLLLIIGVAIASRSTLKSLLTATNKSYVTMKSPVPFCW